MSGTGAFDPKVIFSDIDGTLVHYTPQLEALGYCRIQDSHEDTPATAEDTPRPKVVQWEHTATGIRIDCFEVPSLTLGGGFVTCKTLALVDVLRQKLGVKFAIVTGARTATWVGRRACGTSPRADFDVAEGGGKVWRMTYAEETSNGTNDSVLSTASADDVEQLRSFSALNAVAALHDRTTYPTDTTPLGIAATQSLDEAWLDRFEGEVGPWRENEAEEDPTKRKGPLWDVYRLLQSEIDDGSLKAKLDAKSYCSAFLFDYRKAVAEDPTFDGRIRARFETELKPKYGVAFFTNLGKAHVSSARLGKRSVVEYIAGECISSSNGGGDVDTLTLEKNAVALFDDENDLQFAKVCGEGYMPSVSHPRVLEALAQEEGTCDGAEPGGRRSRWRRVRHEGLLGTEEALVAIMAQKASVLLHQGSN